MRFAEDAKNAVRVGADTADQTALILVIFACNLLQTAKDAVAFAQRRIRGFQDQKNAGFGAVALPFQRAGEKIALGIGAPHLQNGDGRQFFRVAIGSLAFL